GFPTELQLCDTLKKIPSPPGVPKSVLAPLESYGQNIARQVPSLEDYNKQLESEIKGLEAGGPPSGVDKTEIELDWDSGLKDLKSGQAKHADEFPAIKAAGEALAAFNCGKAHAEYTKAAIAGEFAWSILGEGGGLN